MPRPRTAGRPVNERESREPTLVLDVDLRDPLPDVPGDTVTRVWLRLRLGDQEVGKILLGVPRSGLSSAVIGAAIASRIGAQSHPRIGREKSDRQPRSRRRGSTSEL